MLRMVQIFSLIMYYILLVNVLLTFPTNVVTSNSLLVDNINKHFILLKNLVPDGTSVEYSVSASSQLSCALTCVTESRENRCTIASYTMTSRQCTLTTSSFGSLIYSSSNDTVTLFPIEGCDTNDLPVINNGQYIMSDFYSIVCDSGYYLSLVNEINTMVCDVNGAWIQSNLTCVPRSEINYVEGRSFITAFMPNYQIGDVALHLLIAASDDVTATAYSTVTVDAPYVNFSQTLSLTNLVELEIPIGLINDTTGIPIPNAVSIKSDKPVTVFATNSNQYSSGGLLVLPEQSLSKSYIVAATPYDDPESRLVIIPMLKTTEVRITFPGGSIINTAVEAGSAYQLVRSDISGAIVESDEDVVVLAGEWCANLPDPGDYSCDHIVEQMPPMDALDTLYIVAQTKPRSKYILNTAAVNNGTNVSLRDASDKPIYSVQLDRGQTFSITVDNEQVMSVTADSSILVTQYGVSASVDNATHGDASMFVVPGVNHFMDKYRFVVPKGYDINRVLIIYNTTSTGNGTVSDPRAGLFHNGVQEYIADMTSLQVSGLEFEVCYLEVAEGVHKLENNVKFGAILYGQKRFNEYAWNLGMYMGKV